MPDITHDIVRESPLWPDDGVLDAAAGRITALLPEDARGSITFAFCDDAHVRTLNHAWRGKDAPTNVLSFPDGDADEDGRVHLGDVILAYETLAREAGALDIAFDDHLAHLLLHGCLHLLGYDHITDDDAAAMEGLETRLLAKLGIKDPYQDGAKALD